MSYIFTYTGKMFYPLDPNPDLIDIEDIAHALSMTCRFGGHCSKFYSVAEHSVIVSHYVPSRYALNGLLHDAAEAYLCDIPSPVKKQFPLYKKSEENLMFFIKKKFDLEDDMGYVKEIDRRLLVTEMRQLMNQPDWGHNPIEGEIRCLSPEEAKKEFLERFNILSKEK